MKITNSQFYAPCYCLICASNKYAPLMPNISHICKLIYVQILDNYVSMYALCRLNTISKVTLHTGILTFHIIFICSWRNVPATVNAYVPLHCYYRLHTGPILLHISFKNNKLWHLLWTWKSWTCRCPWLGSSL